MTTHDQTNDLRERPVGEVATELARDVSLLVRQEIALGKAELREKGRIAVPGLVMIGVAGVVAVAAAGAATAFLVLLFALFLDAWLAALVVGALLAGTAALLAIVGKERVQEAGSPIPEQTIETIKEDAEWVTERAKSARR